MIRVFNQYISVKSVLLMGLESVLIVMSFLAGAKLHFWHEPAGFLLYTRTPGFLLQIFTVLMVLETCCYYNDLYDLNSIRPPGNQFVRLAQALGTGCLLLSLLSFIVSQRAVDAVLFIALGLTAMTMSATRLGLDFVWNLVKRERKVLILGGGEMASSIVHELEERTDLNFRIIGFVTPQRSDFSEWLGYPVLGCNGELYSIAREQHVARIIVALDDFRGGLPTRELVRLKVQGIEVDDAPSALAALTGRIWLRAARPSWFVFSNGFQHSDSATFVKRIIDLAFGLLGAILSLPAMFLIALAIRLDSKGPVLYRQQRVGMGGSVFNLIKFRSMQFDAEAEYGAQWAQENDPRLTRVGRFLRKHRLDELPQFFNVIRGEMSFVGPRPERPVFVEQLREKILFYDERHSVRPGVTGWAQVQYRYGASIEDAFRKLEYDLFYLKNRSILFDLAIVFRTIGVVVFGRGR